MPELKENKFVLSESDIQSQIANYCVMQGFLVIRNNSGTNIVQPEKGKRRFIRYYTIVNTGASAGRPDLEISKNGKTIYLEIKKDLKAKQTPGQKVFQALCDRFGNPYYVVWSLEQVINILDHELN